MINRINKYKKLIEKYNFEIEIPNFQQIMNEEELCEIIGNYDGWIICHADLPYMTKHFANTISAEINENEIIIAQSKDNGTPFIAGTLSFNKFLFGKNSFNKHIEFLIDKKYAYKQIFSTEFTFELDDEEDYKKFIQNQPRWFRKLNA